jgi:surface polysaccharide O-acyltransferase-like enzyme
LASTVRWAGKVIKNENPRKNLVKIDPVSSERLNILRFPLIVGVVFIHAYGSSLGFSGVEVGVAQVTPFVRFVEDFISQGVARIAVPLFFLMSGYLFFVGFEWSLKNYLGKVRTRIKTLLIPFLFWNLLVLALFALGQALPATRTYFSGNNVPISSYHAFDFLNEIFGIAHAPIATQFWFIEDLMLLVLLVPVIHLMHKYFPYLFLAAIFIAWLVGYWFVRVPSAPSVLFFFLGSVLAVRNKNLFALDKYGPIFLIAYVIVVIIDTLTKSQKFNLYINNIGIILGIISVLFLTLSIQKNIKLKNSLLWLGKISFFVFAAHEPTLIIVRKLAFKIIEPNSSLMILFLYLFIPLLVIVFLILIYRILIMLTPRFVKIITGER